MSEELERARQTYDQGKLVAELRSDKGLKEKCGEQNYFVSDLMLILDLLASIGVYLGDEMTPYLGVDIDVRQIKQLDRGCRLPDKTLNKLLRLGHIMTSDRNFKFGESDPVEFIRYHSKFISDCFLDESLFLTTVNIVRANIICRASIRDKILGSYSKKIELGEESKHISRNMEVRDILGLMALYMWSCLDSTNDIEDYVEICGLENADTSSISSFINSLVSEETKERLNVLITEIDRHLPLEMILSRITMGAESDTEEAREIPDNEMNIYSSLGNLTQEDLEALLDTMEAMVQGTVQKEVERNISNLKRDIKSKAKEEIRQKKLAECTEKTEKARREKTEFKRLNSELKRQVGELKLSVSNKDKLISELKEKTEQFTEDAQTKGQVKELREKSHRAEKKLKSAISENKELREEMARLREELEELKKEDKAVEDMQEGTEESIEEVLDGLSDKRILIYGGREELGAKLEETGLTGVRHYSEDRIMRASDMGKYDIAVILTNRVAHSLCKNVQADAKARGLPLLLSSANNVDKFCREVYRVLNKGV